MRKLIPIILGLAVNIVFNPTTVFAAYTDNEISEKPYISATFSPEVTSSLDAYFNQLATYNKFIGSVGVYQGNTLRYLHANTLNQDKITSLSSLSNTGNPEFTSLKYRIGSITKVFTGVMVLQLVQEKKLSLDTKLSVFYPQITNAEKITIAQLLNHQSGIKSFTTDPAILNLMYKPQTSETILAMIASYDASFEPGSTAEYSNSNFYLLGHIIEKITASSYQENLASRITNPLKLSNTYYGGKINPENGEVYSYIWSDQQWHKAEESDMSVPHGAGAIVSTVEDLQVFVNALFKEKLINKNLLTRMTTIEYDYGKAIFKMVIDGQDTYSHNGLIDQFNSIFLYQPATDLSVITLSNGNDFNQRSIATTLLNANKGELAKIPDFTEVKLASKTLERYTGVYTSETFPLDISLFVENEELYAQASGQGAFPLTATSNVSFGFSQANISIMFDQSKLSLKPEFTFSQHDQKHVFVKSADIDNKSIIVSEETMDAYQGIYKSDDFPLDIKVFVENKKLMAQATGQGAFLLTPVSETEFHFSKAGIVIKFEPSNNQLLLSQGGVETHFNK